jgi:hypothetical protein
MQKRSINKKVINNPVFGCLAVLLLVFRRFSGFGLPAPQILLLSSNLLEGEAQKSNREKNQIKNLKRTQKKPKKSLKKDKKNLKKSEKLTENSKKEQKKE